VPHRPDGRDHTIDAGDTLSISSSKTTTPATLAGTAIRVRQDGRLMSSVPVAGRGLESGRDVAGSTLGDLLNAEAAEEVVRAVRSALTWRRGGLAVVPWGEGNEQARAHVYPLSDDEALVVFDVRREGDSDELALSMRETLHRMVVADSPNPIFLINENRRIVEANPALGHILGYEPSELIGLELFAIESADAVEVESRLRSVSEAHHDIMGERRYRRKDGSLVDVLVSANLMFADSGRLFCFFAREISEEKRLEQERQQLERQLWESQKHDALGQLAGGVAHDFNHLLTMIQLSAHQLSERPLDSAAASELRRIITATQRAKELSRQLLNLSGKQPGEPRRVDLNQSIRDMQDLLERSLGPNISLRTRLSDDVGTILADPQQVDQIILNLVVNASDAMRAGGTITVTTSRRAVDQERTTLGMRLPLGQYVVLQIADTGPGIAPYLHEQIFDPFYTTKEDKGTGLGLAMVRGMMQRLGGAIVLESAPGAGSTFELHFPWQGTPAYAAIEERRAPASAGRASERLLVIDDQVHVRRLTARVLRQLGYTVFEAASGEAALEALASLHEQGHGLAVDALITDVSMPRMSGPELVRQLRVYFPGLPAIFISGEVSAEDAGIPLTVPGTVYLPKPFEPAQLKAALRAVLGRPAADED
jgi:two-component system, cell cycle sensor histidine kinase and response regulator CckA